MGNGERRPGSSRDTIFDDASPSGESEVLTSSSIELVIEDEDDLDAFRDLAPGSTLGRYVIEGVLGKGATGVVFDASHRVIGKRVAIKCLYPQHSSSPTAVERFFREARIAATVEHPNVIQVFDGGKERGVLFLAMERLEGRSLDDRLEEGAIPSEEAIELFLGIMDGVSAVHARGVVHRDLKPDNIFLVPAPAGTLPKVLDFGISKLKEPGLRELTTLGSVMGTPSYMAPEQVTNSRDVDVRADVYSLGVMLYEALVGQVPYPEASVIEVFRRAKQGDATPIERLRPEVAAEVAAVVARAMRPDRSARFGSVAEMRAALANARPREEDLRPTIADLPALPPITPPSAIEPSTKPSATTPSAAPPPWMWPALALCGAVTFLSVLIAIVALLV